MRRYAAEGALVAAAFLFGVTFPLVHDALDDVTPFAYLVLRFAIALIVLGPFAIAIARRRGDDRRMLVRVGIIAGVLLFGGYATQTAVLATIGLYLLTGADVGGIGRGELLTLACAFLFAIWIVYQGGYAARLHPIPFTTMQMVTLVVVGLPAMARQGVGELNGQVWFAIVFTGVACSAVALSLQLWGQRRIAPSRAALILLMEPVFAGLAGYLDGERLGAVEIVGAAVILVAIAIAELGPRLGWRPRAAQTTLRG